MCLRRHVGFHRALTRGCSPGSGMAFWEGCAGERAPPARPPAQGPGSSDWACLCVAICKMQVGRPEGEEEPGLWRLVWVFTF